MPCYPYLRHKNKSGTFAAQPTSWAYKRAQYIELLMKSNSTEIVRGINRLHRSVRETGRVKTLLLPAGLDKLFDSYTSLTNSTSQSADRKFFMFWDYATSVPATHNNMASFLTCLMKAQNNKNSYCFVSRYPWNLRHLMELQMSSEMDEIFV